MKTKYFVVAINEDMFTGKLEVSIMGRYDNEVDATNRLNDLSEIPYSEDFYEIKTEDEYNDYIKQAKKEIGDLLSC